MSGIHNIKINFKGGIISPGKMFQLMAAASRAGIREVSFGLRQQLLVPVSDENLHALLGELRHLEVDFETNNEQYPNIMSSYAAADIFINHSWLSEGVYKDIFEGFNYRPQLKINISDQQQSFTPMLTGNINWIASATPHYWWLVVRYPKTNSIRHWNRLLYTNDIPAMSRALEQVIMESSGQFDKNPDQLFELIPVQQYITKEADKELILSDFNLPYYEGLNRYNNKLWLGVYRRDEMFEVEFLKNLSRLCLDTRTGHFCSTPWKSIIVKNIEEKDRLLWNRLLDRYLLNMRHAANELNFQVEDLCEAGLSLKNFLVKSLNDDDIRTFGLCIGIKTRRKSEIFSSILVRRKPLLRLFGREFFHVYDLLHARNFNPNERTGTVFSRNNPKFLLAEQLRRSVLKFYQTLQTPEKVKIKPVDKKEPVAIKKSPQVSHCRHCLTVYDPALGDVAAGVLAGTAFQSLPSEYLCSVCEAPLTDFVNVVKVTKNQN